MISLIGHGFCNPTTDAGRRMADELESRAALH